MTDNNDDDPGNEIRTMVACCCGREFRSRRGMKIHRTKMGCLEAERRPPVAEADREADEGTSSQDDNHSAEVPNQADRSPVCARIKWPKMNNEAEWQKLDSDLSTVLNGGLKGNIQQRLATFQKITHQYCLERYGAEERAERKEGRPNRRQVEKGQLREQHRNLKKQWKEAREEEKEGLLVLMDDIRKKIKAISRAEYERKKRRDKRKKREQFIHNPYAFTKQLFE